MMEMAILPTVMITAIQSEFQAISQNGATPRRVSVSTCTTLVQSWSPGSRGMRPEPMAKGPWVEAMSAT
ncbi:hypothetical protein D3C87_1804720 [compost metagenome]